jgi:hypothetical protein
MIGKLIEAREIFLKLFMERISPRYRDGKAGMIWRRNPGKAFYKTYFLRVETDTNYAFTLPDHFVA